MLCKCSGKYIDIYFNLKITYFGVFPFIFLMIVLLFECEIFIGAVLLCGLE